MILNDFSLHNQTALVTGASSGIGQSIAAGLAEAGANIIAMSRLDCDQTAALVRATGRQYRHIAVDFANRAQLRHAIDTVQREEPCVDILVNNAGVIRRAPASEHTDEDWDQVLEINLSAQFMLTRDIGRLMLLRGTGKIICICSLLSFQGGVTVPGYAASKGGLAQLVKAFANEWAGKGLYINGIAPGYVKTPNTQALQEDPERSQSILARIPQGRWATPADFKGPAVFLASAASNYVNGEILTVDGGWMAR